MTWIRLNSSFAPADGKCTFAVSDIHGQGLLLTRTLEAIRRRVGRRKNQITLIFLGDLIDRGPDVFLIIAKLKETQQDSRYRVLVIRGNHERTFERYVKGELDYADLKEWVVLFGGKDTLEACGLNAGDAIEQYEKGRRQSGNALTEHLFKFSSECLDFVELGGVVFVHEPALGARLLKTGCRGAVRGYVHGHVIVSDVEALQERIALDLGSYLSGTVAVLQFIEGASWYCKIRASYR